MNFDLSKALTLLDGTVVYLSTICGHLILADNDTSQDQISNYVCKLVYCIYLIEKCSRIVNVEKSECTQKQ